MTEPEETTVDEAAVEADAEEAAEAAADESDAAAEDAAEQTVDLPALIRALRSKADARAVTKLQTQIKTLADATTEAIGNINTNLAAVNAKTQRAGTTTALVIGTQDFTIAWPTPWPDTAYGAWPSIISGPAQLGNIHVTVKTKTTDDVTVTVSSVAVVASAGIDVLGVRT